MEHQEWQRQSADRLGLYTQSWAPAGAPRAVLTLVHGFGEHSGRYGHVAAALVGAGYALVTGDHRGHGQSQGRRGHTPTYEHLMDDVGSLLGAAAERFPGRPQLIYGHSMGGNLALNYVLRRRPALDGAVVTAPWLRLAFAPPRWKVAIGRAMDRIYPALLQSSGQDFAALSRDGAIGAAYAADPLVHTKISARMFTSLYAAGLWALDHAAEFALPLLLMHGGADTVTSAAATREFGAKVPDCTLKIWDGFFHEIHNEPEQQQIFDAITGWLDARVPALELPLPAAARYS